MVKCAQNDMTTFLSTKEGLLTFIAAVTALTLLWKGFRSVAREIRKLIKMITYTQNCLEQYGPTLIAIGQAFQLDQGKGLIDSVKRIESLSVAIKADTHSVKRASDISIDVLQAGVGALQTDTRELVKAFGEFESKTEAGLRTLTADIRTFVKENQR